METIFVTPANDFTGSTQVMANLLKSMPDKKYIICENNSLGSLSNINGLIILAPKRIRYRGKNIVILSSVIHLISSILLLLKYQKEYRTIYINTIKPYYAAIVGKILRKQIIYHIHEKYVVRTLPVKIYEYVFNHTRAKRIYVSKYLMEQYLRRDDSASEIRYNKLSDEFIDKVSVVPIERRNRDTVLMISSFSVKKGICNFAKLSKLLPHLKFILVVISSPQEAAAFAKEMNSNNLEVYPTQSDIHPFLMRSDIIINMSIPSLWVETFGMTILEGMAYGLPAIVPNVGGPVELVNNGVNGYCVDVTDLNSVADTILKSLDKSHYYQLSIGSLNMFKNFR